MPQSASNVRHNGFLVEPRFRGAFPAGPSAVSETDLKAAVNDTAAVQSKADKLLERIMNQPALSETE